MPSSIPVTSPLEAIWWVQLQIREHLQLTSIPRALLPSQHSVPPDNYTPPFIPSSFPTQDSTMRAVKMKTSSEKIAMSSLISDRASGPSWVQSENVSTAKNSLISSLEHIPMCTHRPWGFIMNCHRSVRSDWVLGLLRIPPL